jgi:outer membrane protein assembly factor BamB
MPQVDHLIKEFCMAARFLLVFAVACCVPRLAAADFPQFRGVDGRGITDSQSIPLQWVWNDETSQNIAWKVAIPGSGWSQPIVVGNKLYVTAAVGEKELKPSNFSDGVKNPQSMGLGFLSRPPSMKIDWKIFCLDASSGSTLWEAVVDSGKPEFAIHPSNTYATESPVADANGVYAYFGATGKIAGLSHSGDLMWQRDVGAFKTSNNFGTGSSLAIYQGKVYLQNLSQGSADILCLDTQTGNIVWQQTRDEKQTSWSSPIIWRNASRVELIVSGGERVDSYAPDTGEVLWTLKNVKAATACSVCSDAKRIYFGGSDPFSTGSLFAVGVGGSGDISPDKKNSSFETCDWIAKRSAPGMASPVCSGSLVYIVDKNILRCYDAETGERKYQERLPKINMVNSSPIIIGDQLLLIDESGNAALVQVGPEFKVVGGGKIDDTFWSTPAVANDRLYFRGVDALYCVQQQ